MTVANTVSFGIKNVHYAIHNDDGTMKVPVPFPGAVSMTNTPKGEMSEFFADNIVYYGTSTNQGYEGTFGCAEVPDHFLIDVLGYKLDDKGVLAEDANAKPKKIAWLFEFDTDVKAVRRCLPNVSVSRPGFGSSTKTSTAEPNTTEISYVAAPDENGNPQYKTSPTTDETVYEEWYKSVYGKEMEVVAPETP